MGPLIPLFWTSGHVWVSKPEWAALFAFGGSVCDVLSLRCVHCSEVGVKVTKIRNTDLVINFQMGFVLLLRIS